MMKRLLLLLGSLTLGANTWANAPVVQGPQTCTGIRPAIQRLACFDQWFETPVYIEAINIPNALRPDYGIVEIVNRLEGRREPDSYDLLLHTAMEHEDVAQQRVVLAAPALGAIGARPILALSCIDNISRVQLILPEPLAATRAAISIRNQKGRSLLSEPWKVIDGGYIVDAGRGIPSIRIAQRLNGDQRVIISSDQAALEGLVFDLETLPQHIVQLAKACHWRGLTHLRGAKR